MKNTAACYCSIPTGLPWYGLEKGTYLSIKSDSKRSDSPDIIVAVVAEYPNFITVFNGAYNVSISKASIISRDVIVKDFETGKIFR